MSVFDTLASGFKMSLDYLISAHTKGALQRNAAPLFIITGYYQKIYLAPTCNCHLEIRSGLVMKVSRCEGSNW
jgi:hypothetical protein